MQYEIVGTYIGTNGELNHFVEIQKIERQGELIQYLVSGPERIDPLLRNKILEKKINWEQE